jgi:hypothetical protein
MAQIRMPMSAMDKDKFFMNIIQKTPHVEDLAKSINSVNIEQKFPSIDEVSIMRTVHMKCFGHL